MQGQIMTAVIKPRKTYQYVEIEGQEKKVVVLHNHRNWAIIRELGKGGDEGKWQLWEHVQQGPVEIVLGRLVLESHDVADCYNRLIELHDQLEIQLAKRIGELEELLQQVKDLICDHSDY